MTARASASLVVLVMWASGCYRSHASSADGGDAGPPCEFSVRPPEGVETRCSISPSSLEGCTEAAECICAASGRATSAELLRCAGWALAPRGAITFADFCTSDPPARSTMAEALEGTLGVSSTVVSVSDGCRGSPALIGPRPYERCMLLAEWLCPCGGAEPCELDALLGRACLSLTRDEVDCVLEIVTANVPCSADVAAALRTCGR